MQGPIWQCRYLELYVQQIGRIPSRGDLGHGSTIWAKHQRKGERAVRAVSRPLRQRVPNHQPSSVDRLHANLARKHETVDPGACLPSFESIATTSVAPTASEPRRHPDTRG